MSPPLNGGMSSRRSRQSNGLFLVVRFQTTTAQLPTSDAVAALDVPRRQHYPPRSADLAERLRAPGPYFNGFDVGSAPLGSQSQHGCEQADVRAR